MKLKYRNEKEVVNSIIHYLNGIGHFVWRNNSGVVRANYKGKERVWRAGIKGGADVIGIAKDGKFIAVECKHGSNKATRLQKLFLDDIESRGGYSVIARGIDDLPDKLKN